MNFFGHKNNIITLLLALSADLAQAESSRDARTLSSPGSQKSLDTQALDSGESESNTIPDSSLPQSDNLWRYPHTPQKARFGLTAGDHGGGPIRYNTRFPEVKENPHPASYYHTAAHVGAEVELSFGRGGIILGGLSRVDLWHPGIRSRAVTIESVHWVVRDFEFQSNSFFIGWVLGERFREAPWSADFSILYDRGSVTTTLARSDSGGETDAHIKIEALSLRSRIMASVLQRGGFVMSVGPEIHLPIWYTSKDVSSSPAVAWASKNLDLKAAASLGYSVMSSVSF